jgi:hypothetical protein
MPVSKKKAPPTAEKKQLKLNLKLRETLGSAYAFVRGREYTRQTANITYEQLLDRAIHAIEGTAGQSEVRGSKLSRVMKLKEEVGKAVTTVKSKPPEAWVIESDSRTEKEDAANTKE